MDRRGFLKTCLGGVAAAVVAPLALPQVAAVPLRVGESAYLLQWHPVSPPVCRTAHARYIRMVMDENGNRIEVAGDTNGPWTSASCPGLQIVICRRGEGAYEGWIIRNTKHVIV